MRIGPLFAALLLVSFLGALDHTIVASSLATVAGELGSVDRMAWMVTAYSLAMTVAMPVYGQLGDILGRRGLFFVALGIFIVGSLACGFSTDMAQLTGARVIQGIGGAGTAILSQAILADVIPARRRPKFAAMLGSVFGVAIVVGPLVGGLLTDTIGWRWIFFINVPLGLLALAVAGLTLPRVTPGAAGARLDVAGAVLLAGWITGLALIATWGGSLYPWSSPLMVGIIGVAAASFSAFLFVEARVENPIVPLGILRDRVIAGGMVLALVLGAGMFSVVSYLPAYVQMRYTVSATVAGMVPLGIVAGMMVASNTTGLLVSRTGRYRLYPILGTAVAALAFFLAAATSSWLPLPALAAVLSLVGLGVGSFMQLVVVIIQNQVRHAVVGVVTSTANLTRHVGVTVGTAVVGGYLGATLVQRLAAVDLPRGVSPEAITPEIVSAATADVQRAVAAAYTASMTPVFSLLGIVFLLGLVTALLIPAPPLSETLHRDDAPAAGRPRPLEHGTSPATARDDLGVRP